MYHASRTVAGKDAGIFLFYFSHSSLWPIELCLYSSFLSTIDQLTATFIDNIFTTISSNTMPVETLFLTSLIIFPRFAYFNLH